MPRELRILGVRVDDVTFDGLVEAIDRWVNEGGAHQVSTVNTEFLIAARHNPAFASALAHTALNVPDSAGILWAARWLGRPLRERVTGSDGIYRIANLCAERGYRLYLLGAGPGVAARVGVALARRYPGLVICGTEAGSYAVEEEAAIAARIRQARADVLLVAFPSVPQETWIARNLAATGAPVGVGVGAAFDFVAGVQVRAPLWMRRAGLEWLYRLIREPARWRRMLALPYAAWLVFWQGICQRIRPQE
ncbi:MAG: WecB/TagA/CpsF family glycosyltransferase [Anaerolineae bacterium]|nr:WecB/TagA/CpsF family glycosyltransferase [Anaerolineae bacterium]